MGISKALCTTLAVFSLSFLAGCAVTQEPPASRILACQADQGNWLEEHQECEFMSEQSCSALGGKFDACASGCRHDSEAMVCVLMCVPVCSFES